MCSSEEREISDRNWVDRLLICSRGETGRHLGLRSQFCKKSAGSNPVANTCYFLCCSTQIGKAAILKILWFFISSTLICSTCYFYAHVMQLADISRLDRGSYKFKSCHEHFYFYAYVMQLADILCSNQRSCRSESCRKHFYIFLSQIESGYSSKFRKFRTANAVCEFDSRLTRIFKFTFIENSL